MDNRDADRLALLDRIAERVPELDLSQHAVEWSTLPDDGSEALLVDGGGVDGGSGTMFVSYGDDVHAIGSLAPLADAIGCIVIGPDGSRYLAHAVADPLAEQKPD